MPPFVRRLLQVIAGIIGVLILLLIGIGLVPDDTWKHLIAKEISKKTGRDAAIDGPLHLHLFRLTPSISADGFRLQNASWAPARPMLEIKHFEASVKLFSLLKFSPVFPLVRIDTPDVDLERDANQRANWDFSSAGSEKPAPSTPAPLRLPVIQQLIVSDGQLTASDAVRKLKFQGHISIAERVKNADEHALDVRGSGTLNGKPFDLRISGGPLLSVDTGKPYDFDTAMTAADIKLDAHTRILRAFDLGGVDSSFHLQGKDLADAYYLTGLALPNTPAYDLSGAIHRHDLKFDIDDFKGRLGKSDIAGTIAIDTGLPRPFLRADLKSSLLNLADLAAPLGTEASAENKSGTLAPAKHGSVNPRSEKSGGRARPAVSAVDQQSTETGYLLPDADLQINRVREMDADVRFDAASIQSEKMPMKKVQFHLLLNDGHLKLAPLEFTLPEGQFSGEVSIDAHQPVPVTDIDMKLSNVNLAEFKSKGSNAAPLSGTLVGRIRLHGRGTSPHKAASNATGELTFVVPHGEMSSAFAELTGINVAKGLGLLLTKKDENTEIRCGVVSFHADDGDLKANSLLVDTSHVRVTGKGHINLKDEALNVELQGKPKEIRLVRIRAPIEIHGTLAHPDVGLKAGPLVGQTAAAVALGTFLTPAAALLAFVDKGLAKDANCSSVIDQADTAQGAD